MGDAIGHNRRKWVELSHAIGIFVFKSGQYFRSTKTLPPERIVDFAKVDNSV